MWKIICANVWRKGEQLQIYMRTSLRYSIHYPVHNTPSMISTKQFISDNGTCTYILYDQDSKEALLIDPMSDTYVDTYMSFLEEHDLRLTGILDTHTHADHISGSLELRERTGADILMSEHSPSKRVTRRLSDGDEIVVGPYRFTVLYTPGHTNESICLYGEGTVYTGDTMLLGGTGRTDFQLGNSKDLYESLQTLCKLPEETVVAPGHTYQEKSYSTIKEEKEQSPRLQLPFEEFVETMDGHHPKLPELFEESILENSK